MTNHCLNCGIALPTGSETCANCEKSRASLMVCPKCKTSYDSTSSFCLNDGKKLIPIDDLGKCRGCLLKNNEGAQFCSNCGLKLTDIDKVKSENSNEIFALYYIAISAITTILLELFHNLYNDEYFGPNSAIISPYLNFVLILSVIILPFSIKNYTNRFLAILGIVVILSFQIPRAMDYYDYIDNKLKLKEPLFLSE